jgi:hypothetical protein
MTTPTMVGVAGPRESFYKPELDAAHHLPPQAIRPTLADGVLIPSPGITINQDSLT